MLKIENNCVDCALPCIGDSCNYRNVKTLYCDSCSEELEKLYEYKGDELCDKCLLEALNEDDVIREVAVD